MSLERFLGILKPQGQGQRFVLVIVGVLVLSLVVLVLLNLLLSDATRAKDLAGVVQSMITVVAIAAGGVFAFYKLQIFRDFEPHLNVSNSISHRRVGTKYVHVAVIATLHNSSRVEVELRRGFFRLQQLAPISDEGVESLYAQVFIDAEKEYLQWPILEEVPRVWDEGELIVEPGESHSETYEFIVEMGIESVIIYTYFYNPQHSRHSRTAEGWHATTIYDIIRKA